MTGMDWDILGHAWAANMLRQHIVTGGLRHAYLFSGPPGIGRRTLALRLAQAVNCTNPPEAGAPCGVCRTCQQIDRMQQADLTIVQSPAPGETLKVEQVRELQQALSLAPYESAYRIALLLRFDEATEGAQNALLKTLEEPNARVLMLLTANDPDNLLPTIRSRCEWLRLRPMSPRALAEVLTDGGLEAEQARLIAHVAGGRPGYAQRLAEDGNLLASREEWIKDFFGLLASSRRGRLSYSESKSRKRDRAEAKQDLRDGLAHWLSLWRDVLLLAAGSPADLTNLDREKEIRHLAGSVSDAQAAGYISRLEHCFARINSANLQVMLDTLLLEWPEVSN